MPRLLIDGNDSSGEAAGLPDFSALMEFLYKRAADQGRVVCRVEVDGRELDADAERDLASAPLSGMADVQVTTGSADDLYESGIEGALSLADAMCTDIGRAAASFRQGDLQGGIPMYVACVTSMETFFRLSEAILGCFPAPEGGGEAPSVDTAGILGRMVDAQRREDWTLMADLLEYEVVPNLESWKGYLAKLKKAQAK